MKTVFNIVITIVVIAILSLFVYVTYHKLTDKIQKTVDGVVSIIEKETIKQDSLLKVINVLEDSLNKKKVERIKEIEIRYEKTIDSIKFLNPTEQVELLTRNLSEINSN